LIDEGAGVLPELKFVTSTAADRWADLAVSCSEVAEPLYLPRRRAEALPEDVIHFANTFGRRQW